MLFGLFVGFADSEKNMEYYQTYRFNETNNTTVKKQKQLIITPLFYFIKMVSCSFTEDSIYSLYSL